MTCVFRKHACYRNSTFFTMTPIMPTPCPCGSGRPLDGCCAPYLDGTRDAADAEALMRSRYSAYVLGNESYLLATWHTDTRPQSLRLADEHQVKWLGLSIKSRRIQDAEHAEVEFVARYKVHGRAFRLHETSRFVRAGGRWFYLDGTQA